MANNANRKEIFVGRDGEQQIFTAALQEAAVAAKKGWPFGKSITTIQQPRMFLILGSGGMGKTSLLRRFKQAAQGSAAWVLLNWEDIHEAGDLPQDFPGLLLRLHNAIAGELDQPARKHFAAFAATHENHGQVVEKVRRYRPEAQAEFAQMVSAAGELVGGVTTMLQPQVPGQAVAAGFEFAVHAGAASLARFEDYLNDKLRHRLSGEEYRLYTNPNQQYAASFVAGLVAMSASQPLVLAQDTCEWVWSTAALDAPFRSLVLKPALGQSQGLLFVSSGRGVLEEDYRRSFEGDPRLLHVANLKPFQETEIAGLLSEYELTPELGERLMQKSLGVPLAADTLAKLFKQSRGNVVAEQFPDFDATADEQHVVRQTTLRFLRYIVETPLDSPQEAQRKIADRHAIYALALLRLYDTPALAACWGVFSGVGPITEQEVLQRMQALRGRNEFLFERGEPRMLSLVHGFIREYLRQQVRPEAAFLERPVVEKINQAALSHFQDALGRREQDLPTFLERYEDAQWRTLALNLLNHRFWLDERQALQDLCRRVLEAANYNSDWLPELVHIAREAQPADKELLQALEAGVQTLASRGTDLAPLMSLWEQLEQRIEQWKLPPLYRALLANREARLLAASDRPEEAYRELVAGLEALPDGEQPDLRGDLVFGLVGVAGIYALELGDYTRAIQVANKALSYEPDNIRALHMLVIAKMGQKEYQDALAMLDGLIERFPDTMDFRWARLTIYQVQKRMAEFSEELRQIKEFRPDFVRDLLPAVLKLNQDAQYRQAMTQWLQDAGIASVERELALVDRLEGNPDALAEIMSAQFELSSGENLTSIQILEKRRVIASHLPDYPDVQAQLGSAYLAAGRVDEATAAFERAQSLAPDDPQFYGIPGLLLYWHGDLNKSLQYLQKNYELLQKNSGALMTLLPVLLDLGRVPEAKSLAELALQKEPQNALLRFMYGHVLTSSGEHEMGWQMQREAYRSEPNVLEASRIGLLMQARASQERLRAGIKQEIPGELGEIISSLPVEDMVRLYVEIFRSRLESDSVGKPDPKVLIPVLEEALAHRPESVELRMALMGFYQLTGELETAIQAAEEGLEIASAQDRTELREGLVDFYQLVGKPGLAIAHQQALLEVDPVAYRYFNLAELYKQKGELQNALQAYDQALSMAQDDNAERLQIYGLHNLSAGRLERAEALLQQVVEKRPDDAHAHAYLAEALYRQGRLEVARSTAEQALQLGPEVPDPAARMARILRAQGHAQEADAYHKQALRHLQTLNLYDQACILALLGKKDEALERLKEAVEQSPQQRAWAILDPDWSELSGEAEFKQIVEGQ